MRMCRPPIEPQDPAAFTRAGSPLAGVTVDDTVAHVVEAVQTVRKHGPVVLVGFA